MHTTPEPLSGAEVDLLADYHEGLLDDAEAARVATLIATDARWAAASAALTSALTQVQASLSDLAARPESMPDEFVGRIDRALQDQPRPPLSLDAARERRRGSANMGHRVRLAAAALILVALCGGVTFLTTTARQNNSSSTATSGKEARPDVASAQTGVVITFSGRNYTTATLGKQLPAYGSDKSLSSRPSPAIPGATKPGVTGATVEPPQAVNGLPTDGRLDQCLTDVRLSIGGTPTAVDYGTFDGRPALIVRLTSPDLVVAVGPACGSATGVDKLAQATPK